MTNNKKKFITPGCDKNGNLLGWRSVEIGAMVIDAGNSRLYETGSWRSEQPVWNANTCIDCMMCWLGCPDTAIIAKEGHMAGIDYFKCKGCEICVEQCPTKPNSLVMILEENAKDLSLEEKTEFAFGKEQK